MRGTGVNGTPRHVVDGPRDGIVGVVAGVGTVGVILEEVASESVAAHNPKSKEPTEAGAELTEQGLHRRGEAGAIGRYSAMHLAVHGPVRR